MIAKHFIERIQNFFSELSIDVIIRDIDINSWSAKTERCFITIQSKENQIASFALIPMPGCCGIVISTGAVVYIKYRNKGIGDFLHKLRIDMASDMGYSVLMCTDVMSNKAQQAILTKNNWKNVHEFTNYRTHNLVGIHIINL